MRATEIFEGIIKLKTRNVFLNPTRSQIAAMIANTKYKLLRGMAFVDDSGKWQLCVWPAYALSHYNFTVDMKDMGYRFTKYGSILVSDEPEYLNKNRDWKTATMYEADGFYFLAHNFGADTEITGIPALSTSVRMRTR